MAYHTTARGLVAAMVGSAVLVAAPLPWMIGDTMAEEVVRAQFARPTTIPAPAANALTEARITLGKTLFFDRRLSLSETVACSSCHVPWIGWGDRAARPLNDSGAAMNRRTLPTINLAFHKKYLWDGRTGNLDTQAVGPMTNPGIMGLSEAEIGRRLGAVPGYHPMFETAYPGEPIDAGTAAKAIASFERSLVSDPAPFDDWIAGQDDAIGPEAKRGFALFTGRAGCSACHSGWLFGDDGFHDIGLPNPQDVGRAKQVPGNEKMMFAFRTPSLRDVAVRPPYMHDGSLATLAAVVDFYAEGGIARPSRSDEIRPLTLSAEERNALVVFMKSLTSRQRPFTTPVLP
ncbi:MAG: cytochrome c peroxidase [Rhodospirillaceae bacterium]